MIIVRVEHHGLTGQVTEIGRAEIVHVSGKERGIYSVRTFKGRCAADFARQRQDRHGVVQDHDRALNIWHLIAKALREMTYG